MGDGRIVLFVAPKSVVARPLRGVMGIDETVDICGEGNRIWRGSLLEVVEDEG